MKYFYCVLILILLIIIIGCQNCSQPNGTDKEVIDSIKKQATIDSIKKQSVIDSIFIEAKISNKPKLFLDFWTDMSGKEYDFVSKKLINDSVLSKIKYDEKFHLHSIIYYLYFQRNNKTNVSSIENNSNIVKYSAELIPEFRNKDLRDSLEAITLYLKGRNFPHKPFKIFYLLGENFGYLVTSSCYVEDFDENLVIGSFQKKYGSYKLKRTPKGDKEIYGNEHNYLKTYQFISETQDKVVEITVNYDSKYKCIPNGKKDPLFGEPLYDWVFMNNYISDVEIKFMSINILKRLLDKEKERDNIENNNRNKQNQKVKNTYDNL